MSIYENFMEDALFFHQLKQEQRLREWNDLIEQEEKAYDKMAEQYFSSLQQYEICMMEKEYRRIEEWEDLVTI
jgi:hypothetical protein